MARRRLRSCRRWRADSRYAAWWRSSTPGQQSGVLQPCLLSFRIDRDTRSCKRSTAPAARAVRTMPTGRARPDGRTLRRTEHRRRPGALTRLHLHTGSAAHRCGRGRAEAARQVGLDASFRDRHGTALRIEVSGAVRVAGQLQSHPREFLARLFRSRATFGPGQNHGHQRLSAPQHQAVHELLSQRTSLHGISRDFQLAHYAGRRQSRRHLCRPCPREGVTSSSSPSSSYSPSSSSSSS